MDIGGFLKLLVDPWRSLGEYVASDPEEDAPVDSYDPYAEYMSTDNPFLAEEATGFVYSTLNSAVLAHWPSVLTAPTLAADSFENAVLGIMEVFTDDDEASAKGVLFETGRVLASQLDMTEDEVLRMKVLGVYDVVEHELTSDATDTFVSDGCLYIIQGFLTDKFNELFEEEHGLPSLVESLVQYLTTKYELDSPMDGYRIITVTILMIGTRQWITDEFPEFEGVNEDVAGD